LTASFNSTLTNEPAPVHSEYPTYNSFPDHRSDEEQVPITLSRPNHLAADIQQMPPPHQPNIYLNGHNNTCENQSVYSNQVAKRS